MEGHDLACVGRLSLEAFNSNAAAANRWTSDQLTERQTDYLSGLPLRLEVGELTIVHGSPNYPVWGYLVSMAAPVASFAHFDTKLCLAGHSHQPFVCRPAEEGRCSRSFG